MIPVSIPTRILATRFAKTAKRAWPPTRFITIGRIHRGRCYRLSSNPSSPAVSFAVDGEGQQRITSAPDKTTVARIHVEDPIGYRRTSVVKRSARRYTSVHRFEFRPRVEVPDDHAVLARVGPEVAIHRPRKQDPRNQGD